MRYTVIAIAIGCAIVGIWVYLLRPQQLGEWVSVLCSGIMLAYFGALIIGGLIMLAVEGDNDQSWGQ